MPPKTEPKTDSVSDVPPAVKTIEQWAKDKGTKSYVLRAAATLNRWPVGREITETVFDAGIARTTAQSIR